MIRCPSEGLLDFFNHGRRYSEWKPRALWNSYGVCALFLCGLIVKPVGQSARIKPRELWPAPLLRRWMLWGECQVLLHACFWQPWRVCCQNPSPSITPGEWCTTVVEYRGISLGSNSNSTVCQVGDFQQVPWPQSFVLWKWHYQYPTELLGRLKVII